MSRSAQITITSDELRERVEDCLDRQIPDHVWERSEPYARRKLDMAREREPEVSYYNNEYLHRPRDGVQRLHNDRLRASDGRPGEVRRKTWKQQKKGPPDATGRPMREHPTASQLTDPALKV